MEDAQIVTLFLTRDEGGIRAASDKYGSRLRQLGFRLLPDRLTVEECENDAYLLAWDSIPPHQPRDYLFPFLARLMRHTVLDRCRALTRRRQLARLTVLTQELEDCLPGPDHTQALVDALALGESLNAFLKALPEEARNLFLRRYWFFDPIAAIARRYGLTQSKVKTTLFRTRQRLRDHLIKEGFTV